MNKLSKKDFAQRVDEYRALYPGRTLYFTEDGNCFLEKSPCEDHARKTKQKWVESPAEVANIPTDESTGWTKEEAVAFLKESELDDNMDYQLVKDLVKVLELTPVSNSKDNLLVALEEYKMSLTVKQPE
ncbi:MAG TPA: hypothetical protein VK172_14735 [Lentimicrobium sp.]|nr:hypothetical protein [Bacteroidales bacterium]HLO92418.1 hypothetical protein [Lentimicrobium sp.]